MIKDNVTLLRANQRVHQNPWLKSLNERPTLPGGSLNAYLHPSFLRGGILCVSVSSLERLQGAVILAIHNRGALFDFR